MPVDLFPPIKIPVVVVATFYSGMPPKDIENDITGPFERFFTLGSGIDHIESRSLPGVSLIKIYFQPGTDADAAVTSIANLAMADLRRLPPGTLPPVVLKFDASSLPGLPDHTQGGRIQRGQSARPGPICRAQPGGERARRLGAPALRRTLPADHGLCRSAQAGGQPAERDGRGPDGERVQPHPSGRGCENRTLRLQSLSQRPDRPDLRHEPAADQDGRQRLGPDRGHRQGGGRFRHPDQHRAGRRPALGLSAGAEAGRRLQHDRGRERDQGGDRPPGRCAGAAGDQGRVRPVGLRAHRDREPDP